MENSYSYKHGNGRQFRLGHYEVSKCWDMALMQMHEGEISTVTCPAKMDKGGHINQYHTVDDGWVEQDSDMSY